MIKRSAQAKITESLNEFPAIGVLEPRQVAPAISKGFHLGCEDIGATRRFIVYPGNEAYTVSREITALPLTAMMKELAHLS